MASIYRIVRRNSQMLYPPQLLKQSDVVRIGLLGASNIAPMSIITPALSHPEAVIAAVAARDEKKANAYAKKHHIPKVFKSYDEMIEDPAIDAIYIALPNGLHYEWTIKALKAGKHVLLEKPSTSNAGEAGKLFQDEVLKQPNAPVLLEAFHMLFHPSWKYFISLLDPSTVEKAHTELYVFKGKFSNDDIRYAYDLAGGAMMDLGAYTTLCLRQIFASEPMECLECTTRLMPKGLDQKCDQAATAKFSFPNGGIGTMDVDLCKEGAFGIPTLVVPKCIVTHREAIVADGSLSTGQEHAVVKTVSFQNPIAPTLWHRIDVAEAHTIRTTEGKKIIKSWTKKTSKKVHTWKDQGTLDQPGEDHWSTYRHQLEQFVNRIKKREGTGCWMEHEDSIRQMAMIDLAYEKAGLPSRPSRIA